MLKKQIKMNRSKSILDILIMEKHFQEISCLALPHQRIKLKEHGMLGVRKLLSKAYSKQPHDFSRSR